MLLNEKIVVPDITLALEGEEGAFLVSPRQVRHWQYV
jgi:hypothetical protein